MFNVHVSDANAVEVEPSTGAISTSASTTSRKQAWSPSGPNVATNLRNNGTEEVDPDVFVDGEVALSTAKQFASFLDADYRASHYYFVHINILMLLCLLIVANIFKTDASITSAALEMVCIVVIVLIFLALNTIHQPCKRGEQLANVVGHFVLVLCIVEAVVNFLNAVVRLCRDQNAPSLVLEHAFEGMCYCVVVLSFVLWLVIILGYIVQLITMLPESARRRSSILARVAQIAGE
jgi:hypothetical protein